MDVLGRGRVLVSIVLHLIITPLLAFSITYLFNLETDEQEIRLGIDRVEIIWVVIASLGSGIVAMILALVMGGYVPVWVAQRGGWLSAIGILRNGRTPSRLLAAQERLKDSGHGRLVIAVRSRRRTSSLTEIYGGLQLVAVPFQLLLSVVPILLVASFPEGWLRDGHCGVQKSDR